MDASAPRRGGRLRDAVVDAGWAVREHLLWRPADALRKTADAVKWPFERIAWAVRRGLLWRVEDRADALGPMARGVAFGFVIVLAAGAGVAGLLWAAPDRPQNGASVAVATPTSEPAAAPVEEPKPVAPPKPTLQGAAPVFKPTEESSPKAGTPKKAADRDSASTDSSSPSASAADSGKAKPLPSVLSTSGSKPLDAQSSSARESAAVAGPKAVKVAREFAGAFVLYETGRGGAEVRETLTETATPELRKALLRRPPRLPANVEVPKAKVLNVVPGPTRGGVYTVSVSLLRVGLTSELRLDMEPGKGKRWQVTDVLG